MEVDTAPAASRPAALRSLPGATPSASRPSSMHDTRRRAVVSQAFIPSHDTSTSSTIASSAQLLHRARLVQAQLPAAHDDDVAVDAALPLARHRAQPISVADSASSPAVSSVESTAASAHPLSRWAQQREAEQQQQRQHTRQPLPTASTSRSAPISVAKLLYDTSSGTHTSGESASGASQQRQPELQRRPLVNRDDDDDEEGGVARSREHVSAMGMTPSGLREGDESETLNVRTAHLSLVSAAPTTTTTTTVDATADVEETVEAGAEDASESDVAERVLTTLQEKDKLITSLSTALRESEAERMALHRERARLQKEKEVRDERRAIEIPMTPPPESSTPQPPPQRVASISPGTHAAVVSRLSESEARNAELEKALAAKEAALQGLRDDLTDAQQGWELQQVTARAGREQISSLEQRCQQLQQQLDETHVDKREDIATLRAHISQLQAQLDDRAREMKEKDKAHKRQLAGLQTEMEGVTEQFDAQLAALAEVRALKDRLAESQKETQEAREETARVARAADTANATWQLQSCTEKTAKDALAREMTTVVRERDELRRVVETAEHELSCTRKDLAELRQAHASAHEEVAALRASLQRQSSTAAESTLQATRAERRQRELHQRIAELEASLDSAHQLAQQREREMDALRQAAVKQLEDVLSVESTKREDVAAQVRGCAASAEKMEAAVVAAEARRRDAEAALAAAREEVRAAHDKADQAAVQAQKDVLEHQELATAMTAFHREKLTETLAALAAADAARADVDAQLHTTQQKLDQTTVTLRSVEEALATSQQETARLAESVAAQRADLVDTKVQLKKALKAQLVLTRAKNRTSQRLAQYAEAQRAQNEDARRTLVNQRDVWALVGELATVLLQDAEALSPPSVPRQQQQQQQQQQQRQQRLETQDRASRASKHRSDRGGASQVVVKRAKTAQDTAEVALIPLDELVQRTQALRWWCMAQEEQEGARQHDDHDEEEEEESLHTSAEEDEDVDVEDANGVRSLASSVVVLSNRSSGASSPSLVAVSVTEATAHGTTHNDKSRSDTSTHATPVTREQTKPPTRSKKAPAHAASRPGPSSRRAATTALMPMPPLTDALRALLSPLHALQHQTQALQRALAMSRASADAAQSETARVSERCGELERQLHRTQAEARDAVEIALHRAEVEHNKAMAAVDVRWERELDERLRDVARRSRDAAEQTEAAERFIRFDRCQRISEELMEFIARAPEILSRYHARVVVAAHASAQSRERAAERTALPHASTTDTTARLMPPEGELPEPPEEALRGLCDGIVRNLLGLDGGWDDLAQLCVLQDASLNGGGFEPRDEVTGTQPHPHPTPNTHPDRPPAQEWMWPPALLADVEDAVLQYLAARLHCAPTEAESSPSSRHARTIAISHALDHHHPTAGLPAPQSLANSMREWVRSLRGGSAGGADTMRQGTAKLPRAGGVQSKDAGPPIASNLLLSNLLCTCLDYAVDHVIEDGA